MSLSNFFFGDLEEDPIFGHQMRQMRQITNNLFSPFGMFGGGGGDMGMNNMMMMGLVPQRFSPMNRLLLPSAPSSASPISYSSSSSVFCMSSNGAGQPQIYKETSSVRTGPNGIKETRRTVEDSASATKKMSIGHHLGERSRILEKEQNVRTGQREEREELINLEEEEAEEFERNFQRAQQNHHSNRRHQLQIEEIGTEPLQAIQSAEDYRRNRVASPRRTIRSSPLALPSTSNRSNESSLLHPHPYITTPPSTSNSRKQMKSKLKGHFNHH